ncbi:uncharacterized protein LOC132555213 [Ylistrum balloti]|uniref:uncharacterized protein LOC132555213 n=1 Tax=Ylistrum balloti TaxID=509963 RepID=UPI002905D151|nr:uncharacterized protein LOC132555213 [Ylistrum balloti]
MLSFSKLSPVMYRLVARLPIQNRRHDRVFEYRQFCWTKPSSEVRLKSSDANSSTSRHQSHKVNQQSRPPKKVTLHPSAQKLESKQKQSPRYIQSSFDDTYIDELKNLHREDKVPANYSLIYIDKLQRRSLLINTALKACLCLIELVTLQSFHRQWNTMISLGQDPFSISYPMSMSSWTFLLTAVLSVITPFGIALMQTDIRKRVLRIYKENGEQDKYIAVKPYLVFWTKQQHFTGSDIKYMENWEKSLYGLLSGNITIKQTRCRLLPECFQELSGYNEFCGFGPKKFKELK